MKINRWVYASAGVVVLLFAGLVYSWSVFSIPIGDYFKEWSGTQLSLTFTICIGCFCLGGLIAGNLARKINVKINMIISAVLFLLGFWITSNMQSLLHLYVGYGVLAGAASGIAYNTVLSTISRYFPDKPGLISGILLMGFGLGSFIIGKVYQAATGSGEAFRRSFLAFGIILCIVMLLSCLFIRKPKPDEIQNYLQKKPVVSARPGTEDMTAIQMLKCSSFWLYALWSILLSMAGLALISQASAIVREVNPAVMAGTISTAVGLISIFSGIGRVIFGGMYDKAGRGKTMFLVSAVFILADGLLLISLKSSSFPVLIIGFIAAGLGYGGIPPTNSAFVSDFYGKKNYPVNFSVINMNLLVASFGSTIAGILYDMSGSYVSTLLFILIAILTGTFGSLFVRKT